jgi:hypothetical protein
MSHPIPNPTSSEPALYVGAITAVVSAVIGLLVAFGLDLTEKQTGAILALTLAAAPMVSAVITRAKVYSPKTVAGILGRIRPGERP